MAKKSDRTPRNPPHVSLAGLRRATGKTGDQVCAAISEVLGLPEENRIHRGTLSAIESGLRGPSQQMLDAIAIAYGMKPGDIVTDFEPREWKSGIAS